MIIPQVTSDQEGIEVLTFDVYKNKTPITGSLIVIEATPSIKKYIANRGKYFLQFSDIGPVFGSINDGIYPAQKEACLYNKGVFVRELEALYSYAISVSQLNRDRELVDEHVLSSAISSLWEKVDNPDLNQSYYLASHRACDSKDLCKEFRFITHDYTLSIRYNTFCRMKGIISAALLVIQKAELLIYLNIVGGVPYYCPLVYIVGLWI